MDRLSPIKENEDAYSPLQLHFLRRLNHLLRLRAEQDGQLNDSGTKLIDRAIYSAYCDAVDLGVTNEAQRMLQRFAVPAASE